MTTETQKRRGRPVTHEEARAAAQRLVNSFFHNPGDDGARISVPVRPDNDDVTVMDYILEQELSWQKADSPGFGGFGIIHVIRQEDGKLLTFLSRPDSSWGPPHFGLAICDIVRHVAKAFNVHEDAVWEWVDKERENPTTELSRINPS